MLFVSPSGGLVAPNGNSSLVPAAKPFTPPGALHIPTVGGEMNITKGTRINVTIEYEALNYQSSWKGMVLRFPTMDGTFTQADGNLLFIPVLDRTVTLTGPNYSNGSTTKATEILTKNYTLDPKVQPFLTTLKLAVMANATYGTLRIAFRWEYTIWNPANGTVVKSQWSTFGDHAGQESTVTPAELATLGTTSAEYTTVGSMFWANLNGMVSGQRYWVEVEDPFTGISVEETWRDAPTNISTYKVQILLQNGHGIMAAAPWLVHIHDQYGDILYSIPVYLSDPSTAAVYFSVSPSVCSQVVFNGVTYHSGQHATVAANATYNLTAPACAGYTFSGWSQAGGGAQIASMTSPSTSVVALYNTTVFLTYS